MNAAASIFPRPADLHERALQAVTQMRADAQGQGSQLPSPATAAPSSLRKRCNCCASIRRP